MRTGLWRYSVTRSSEDSELVGVDLALIRDPGITGRNRLAMRSTGVFTESLEEARLSTSSLGTERIVDPVGMANEISLDGRWYLRMFDSPELVTAADITGGWPSTDPLPPGWGVVNVPGAWTLQYQANGESAHGPDVIEGDGSRAPVQPHYTNVIMPFDEEPPAVPVDNPTGVYRRHVDVPMSMVGRRLILRVGAVESVAEIFVDGHSVGAMTDSRLPSEFAVEIDGRASFELAIVVTRYSAQSWVEDQDQWWHGGIQRSVTLHAIPESSICTILATPDLEGTGSTDDPFVGRVDIDLRVDGEPVRNAGWTIEARVEERTPDGSAGGLAARTGPVDVPRWDGSSEAAAVISGMFIDPGVVRCRLVIPDVVPWSHESPNLYRLIVTLVDPDGEVQHVYASSIGFRSVRVTGNELLINGRPVLINGVNIHEHSPTRGRYVTAAETLADLVLMKRSNINAIRLAHYPHAEHFAELCDELGIYVVDEANVESHARQTSLCHDTRFTPTILERVMRMVQRDVHHPSIVIWSLGNESGYGAVHDAAASWVRRVDPTRPIQYEGPFMHDLFADAPVSDIVCPMYTPIDEIVRWAQQSDDDRRPLIMCEYSHAMGNSNGSLSDYWGAFEAEHGLQGGFIWEWVDHGLYLHDANGLRLCGPDGAPSWGYGGDFADHPNDANFVCDGLVAADRVPRPGVSEVAFLGRPIGFGLEHPLEEDSLPSALVVSNRRWFTGLADLRTEWTLLVDGRPVDRGDLDLPDVEPRACATVPLPFDPSVVGDLAPGVEVHLDLVTSSRVDTHWLVSGDIVCAEQVTLQRGGADSASEGDRRVRDDDAGAVVDAGGSSRDVEARDGAALLLTTQPWRPTAFRALTDNDGIRSGWMRGLNGNLARWVDGLGLDSDAAELDAGAKSAVLSLRGGHAVTVERSSPGSRGRFERLRFDFDVPSVLTDLPRLGIEWQLPPSEDGVRWETVRWFGEGPHESYPDRVAGNRVGSWTATIDETYVDHAVPQEHGSREGLRWFALTRSTANGGMVDGLMVMVESFDPGGVTNAGRPAFSVRRHGDAELWGATHTHELAPLVTLDRAWVHLDVAQRGLGTASCGPDSLDLYRLGHGSAAVTIAATAFDPAIEDPQAIYETFRRMMRPE